MVKTRKSADGDVRPDCDLNKHGINGFDDYDCFDDHDCLVRNRVTIRSWLSELSLISTDCQ